MSYDELLTKFNELGNKNLELETENKELKIQNQELRSDIENKDMQIAGLTKMIFGSRREYGYGAKAEIYDVEDQVSFFTNLEEENRKEEEEATEEVVVKLRKKKKSKKATSGIKKELLDTIEKEEVIDSLDSDVVCPVCEGNLIPIGKKFVREEIVYIPAKFKLVKHYAMVYKCTECSKKEENGKTMIIQSVVKKPAITHTFASASLIAHVMFTKFCMGVPFYRQERMWDELGLVLPRGLMANWTIKISEYYLSELVKYILKEMKKECELLHGDETSIQCNKEKGKKASSDSYMWVVKSGEKEEVQGTVFRYSRSRASEVANEIFEGFNDILITDGYEAYKTIPELKAHAGCWTHVRRYFYESIPCINGELDKNSSGYKAVGYIDKLFEIERQIADFDDEKILNERKNRSKVVVEEFYTWLKSFEDKIIRNKKLVKAITYAINQKKELCQFLDYAIIPLSNNSIERAIRPFAIHRKNWLFADTTSGAKANETMYSIVESARQNNLAVEKYITYLLTELPQFDELTDDVLKRFVPWSKELPANIKNNKNENLPQELIVAEEK